MHCVQSQKYLKGKGVSILEMHSSSSLIVQNWLHGRVAVLKHLSKLKKHLSKLNLHKKIIQCFVVFLQALTQNNYSKKLLNHLVSHSLVFFNILGHFALMCIFFFMATPNSNSLLLEHLLLPESYYGRKVWPRHVPHNHGNKKTKF